MDPLNPITRTTQFTAKELKDSAMTDRITIETHSLEESHEVANTIGHLITSLMIGEGAISFKLYANVSHMDVAKLLETPHSEMKGRGYLPSHRISPERVASMQQAVAHLPTARPKSTLRRSMDLATQMAWLEGFSVISECTGRRWCEIQNPERSTVERVKYDPIGRQAIRQHLIEKYRLDLHWLANKECLVGKFGDPSTSAGTDQFGGCLGSAIIQTILNVQKVKRK